MGYGHVGESGEGSGRRAMIWTSWLIRGPGMSNEYFPIIVEIIDKLPCCGRTWL